MSKLVKIDLTYSRSGLEVFSRQIIDKLLNDKFSNSFTLTFLVENCNITPVDGGAKNVM